MILTIDGNDRTSVLVDGTLSVEHRAAGFVSVCSFTLEDLTGAIAIAAEDSVTVITGATTFFSGRVVEISYRPFSSKPARFIKIQCQDLNAQLGEVVIDDEEVFTAEADADIIDSLFDDYLPAVDSATHVDTIQDPMTITLGPCTMRSALSQICTRTGGYFYMDFANALHYFDVDEGVAPPAWWLSDVPDNIDTFEYFAVTRKEESATTRLDGVFVVGDGVSGWRGAHGVGDRTAIVRDNRISTVTGVNNRGDAILNKYGAAQVVYHVSTYKQGLTAGQDVRFVCAMFDIDDTLSVRMLTVKWDGSGDPYYGLELGDAVNVSLINERTWVDVIEENQGPVSAPRLPTSSKGWTHTLVFSADSNIQVSWLAGDINLADGTTYAIAPGAHTGGMGATTFIYLDLDSSETALQLTIDSSVAVGTRKILIAWADPVAAGLEASFFVFGGAGQNIIVDTDNIAGEAITTAKILALTILAGDIAANTITAGQIAAGTITANEIAVNTILAGNIAAGAVKTDELDALAVTTAKLAAQSVTATKIDIGGMGDMLYNTAEGLLLLGPRCEMSATEWWSLRRQLAVISGAFHQESGYWQGTKGLVVEHAETNDCINPSLETNATGWTIVTGGAGRTSGYDTPFGDYCIRLDGTLANDYAATAKTLFTRTLNLNGSIWLKGEFDYIVMEYFDGVGGYVAGTGPIANASYPTWTRVVWNIAANAPPALSAQVRILVKAANGGASNKIGYIDAAQFEQDKAYESTYIDGSLGTGYTWNVPASPHASKSTRAATEVLLDSHAGLIANNDTLSFRTVVQMPYDAGEGIGEMIWYAYGGAGIALILKHDITNSRLRGYIHGAYRLNTDALTFKAGDWLDIVMTLNFTTDIYNLYINGELKANSTANIASNVLSQWNLGTDTSATNPLGGNFCEYCVFDRDLTADEVAALFEQNRATIDAGSIKKPGLYILDGLFKIASSTTGNRIEITADRIAGIDSAGNEQFYLQSSDGKAYAGDGAVILDEDGVTLNAVDADAARIKWGTGFAQISAYQSGNSHYIWVKVPATGESDENAVIFLETEGQGAHDDAQLGVVSEDDDTIAQVYAKVGGNLNLQVTTDAVVIGAAAIPTELGGPLSLIDAAVAPGVTAGRAKIYVDSADGDLKVKFADGFVRTIATDS